MIHNVIIHAIRVEYLDEIVIHRFARVGSDSRYIIIYAHMNYETKELRVANRERR